jgi:Uma2 family endonuclease
MARTPVIDTNEALSLSLDVSSLKLTDEQLIRLFRDNDDYRFELSASGELIVTSPANNKTSALNTKLIQRLANWAEQSGGGVAFDSNTLFTLPNGAKRGPDAAWVSGERWKRLTRDEQESFSKLAPDFVVELRSKSDNLKRLKEKMEEYVANGVQLAWLLDPIANSATIYRPRQSPKQMATPKVIEGDPVLPGFKFDFSELLETVG